MSGGRKQRASLSLEDSIRGLAWEGRQPCRVKVRNVQRVETDELKRLLKVVADGLELEAAGAFVLFFFFFRPGAKWHQSSSPGAHRLKNPAFEIC